MECSFLTLVRNFYNIINYILLRFILLMSNISRDSMKLRFTKKKKILTSIECSFHTRTKYL